LRLTPHGNNSATQCQKGNIENKEQQMRLSGLKTQKITENWRKPHNGELQNLLSSFQI
jgi:hypothetical protein